MSGPGHAPEVLEIIARDLDRNWHAQVQRPMWEESPGPHDWRHFIDPDLRKLWGTFDYRTSMMAYIVAARMAKRVRDRQTKKPPR